MYQILCMQVSPVSEHRIYPGYDGREPFPLWYRLLIMVPVVSEYFKGLSINTPDQLSITHPIDCHHIHWLHIFALRVSIGDVFTPESFNLDTFHPCIEVHFSNPKSSTLFGGVIVIYQSIRYALNTYDKSIYAAALEQIFLRLFWFLTLALDT